MERKKEAGLLQTLPIPEVPWQSISMDFVSGFPKVNGLASVLVVVDRFSKYGIFIVAPHACPAETATELFFKNVTKYFGVPKDIVSDRDARFTERFWTTLFNMMGTDLKFSTANHPQTDGQTEGVNALVEDYLRYYVSASQRNWEQLDEANDSLAKAQRRLKKYADMGRRHVEFGVGDQVLLKLTPQIWKKISSKSVHRGLIPKYDGPFEDLLDTARQQTQCAPPVIQKEFEKTFEEKLDEYWVVREGVTPPTRASVLLVVVTDDRSGCQAVVCAGRHAAHSRRTGLADACAELDSMSQHSAAMCAGRHAAHSGRTGLVDARAELCSVAQHPVAVRWSSTVVHRAC
ncbi:UNVERIFIED_CONTAM: Transposon Ty3-I Gag-Pol polyprotein [Sesamum angustifolium]|uniref:Transposon Ty3-I Gag-Pol polyprotein n=1 Tax=Sesamum angustifolium TaxID=2727405 RepID=A0AAW2K7J7_9LAMI